MTGGPSRLPPRSLPEPLSAAGRLEVVWLSLAAALVVFLVHGIDLSGWLSSNPIYFCSGLGHFTPGILPGYPGWVDFQAGATTQAIGRLNADSWLHGVVPWWNPYVGVGLPLAAGMQSAAFFLPFVLLLHFTSGVLLLKVALQLMAGQAMLAFLRHLKCGLAASFAGAVLWELNGSFAWFSDAPIFPIAFLPLLLLGIERAADAASCRQKGRWRLVAVSLLLMEVAGFPETAYLSGLLALAWAVARWAGLAGARAAFARKVIGGGLVSLLVAAPCLWPFAHYLQYGYVGLRDSGHRGLLPGNFAMAVLPYVFGPLHYGQQHVLWFHMGGYVGLGPIVLALAGFAGRARRNAGMRWLLAAWIVAAVAKSATMPGVTELINLIPAMQQIMVSRYVAPTLSFAVIVLAALAVDDMCRQAWPRPRLAVTIGAFGGALIAGVALVLAGPQLAELGAAGGSPVWAAASGIAGLAILAAFILLGALPQPSRARVAAGILIAEACALFIVPLLSGSRDTTLELGPVDFLAKHLGESRYFSVGPAAPNYGSYFRLASVNHNQLPIAELWAEYSRDTLNPTSSPDVFNGVSESAAREVAWFVAHPERFAAVGVKYVLTYSWLDPLFAASPATFVVWQDGSTVIRELRDPAPYYEVLDGHCVLRTTDRNLVSGVCDQPARLLRRELFFPGWTASINHRPLSPRQSHAVFQEVELPAGAFSAAFSYSPPHVWLAWLASLVGLAILLAGRSSPRLFAGRRMSGDGRSGPLRRLKTSFVPAHIPARR